MAPGEDKEEGTPGENDDDDDDDDDGGTTGGATTGLDAYGVQPPVEVEEATGIGAGVGAGIGVGIDASAGVGGSLPTDARCCCGGSCGDLNARSAPASLPQLLLLLLVLLLLEELLGGGGGFVLTEEEGERGVTNFELLMSLHFFLLLPVFFLAPLTIKI